MEKADIDKIQSKLAKMIKLQEGAEKIGSLEEAAAAAAMVQTLLLKYNLEMSDLDLGKEAPPTTNDVLDLSEVYGWNKSSGPWMISLINTLSRHNLCGIVQLKRFNSNNQPVMAIRVFGKRENIDAVLMLSSQLIHRLKEMVKVSWKSYEGYEKKNTYMRGYLTGAVTGIGVKLAENQIEIEKANIGMTALMVTSDKVIKSAIEDFYKGGLKSSTNKRLKGTGGLQNGFRDGKNMSINKAIK